MVKLATRVVIGLFVLLSAVAAVPVFQPAVAAATTVATTTTVVSAPTLYNPGPLVYKVSVTVAGSSTPVTAGTVSFVFDGAVDQSAADAMCTSEPVDSDGIATCTVTGSDLGISDDTAYADDSGMTLEAVYSGSAGYASSSDGGGTPYGYPAYPLSDPTTTTLAITSPVSATGIYTFPIVITGTTTLAYPDPYYAGDIIQGQIDLTAPDYTYACSHQGSPPSSWPSSPWTWSCSISAVQYSDILGGGADGGGTFPFAADAVLSEYSCVGLYVGCPTTVANSGDTISLVFPRISTTTAVSCSPSTIYWGTSTTCVVSVTDPYGVSVAPGQVSVSVPDSFSGSGAVEYGSGDCYVDSSGRCSVTLLSTVGTISFAGSTGSGFTPGNNTVTATYQYAGTYPTPTNAYVPMGSSGTTTVVETSSVAQPTTTTVSCFPNPATTTEQATCEATVSGGSGAVVTGGTVTFSGKGAPPAAYTYSGMPLMFSPGVLPSGSYGESASYSGVVGQWAPSSGSTTLVVDAPTVVAVAQPTATTVSCSPNPVSSAVRAVCTVSVVSDGHQVTSGDVTLSGKGAPPGAYNDIGSPVLYKMGTLAPGSYTERATYIGVSGEYLPSSGSTTLVVDAPPAPVAQSTTTVVSCSPDPAQITTQAVCTVSVMSDGSQVDGGSVTLTGPGAPSGSATDNGVPPRFIMSTLSPGTYKEVASYSGVSGVYLPSTGSGDVVVDAPAPAPTVAPLVVVLSGSGSQTTVAGQVFPQRLVATATRDGLPISGVTVAFSLPGSSGLMFAGAVTNASAVTDDVGVATSPPIVAGDVVGTFSVKAVATGAPVVAGTHPTVEGSGVYTLGVVAPVTKTPTPVTKTPVTKTPAPVAVATTIPGAHTGEPWAGAIWYGLAGVLALVGVGGLYGVRRRASVARRR